MGIYLKAQLWYVTFTRGLRHPNLSLGDHDSEERLYKTPLLSQLWYALFDIHLPVKWVKSLCMPLLVLSVRSSLAIVGTL